MPTTRATTLFSRFDTAYQIDILRASGIFQKKCGLTAQVDGPSCDNSVTFHSSSIYMQYKLLTTFQMTSLGYTSVIFEEFTSRLEVLMSLLESKPIYTHR